MNDSTRPCSDSVRAPQPSRPGALLLPSRIETVGRSDVGLVRDRNEDRFAIDDRMGLFMVADGIGGCAAGDVAASLAIETVHAFLAEPVNAEQLRYRTPLAAMSLLAVAVDRANRRILDTSRDDPSKLEMGTTFVGVLTCGDGVAIAHAGDSRVYRMRDGRMERLTEDHTVARAFIRIGVARDVAQSLPNAAALTRSLGAGAELEVDTRLADVAPGDVILICTDGIWAVLGRSEIASILAEAAEEPRLAAAADRLIARVLDEGGPDNATCVLLRWPAVTATATAAARGRG